MWSSGIELSLRPQPTCAWDQHKRNQKRGEGREGGHHHIWQLCPLLLSFRNRLSNQCYFISPPVFSIEQAEKKHTTDLISNHNCLLFQVFEKDAKPFVDSSSGSCCCIGTTIGKNTSILQLLCFIQMERSGLMRIKRNVNKSSYQPIEVISCNLKMEPRIVEPEERLAFANYTSRYYLHCHVSYIHLIFT